MKNKIAKIFTTIILLMTLTMTNFIFVGTSIYSYAVSDIKTNHRNVEFEAYFKEGEEANLIALEKGINDKSTLYLQIRVKKEGYFNGHITLENSNFKWKQTENAYINKIEGNTITLNQINAGETAELEIEIEPVKEEIYNTGLLDMVSQISLAGIYRDSTQKDIEIKATREINLKITEANKEENISNEINIITNKILKINGENKRVVQFELKQGLKENNYPIKEITTKVTLPTIEEEQPQVQEMIDLNTMTSYEFKYENSIVEIKLKNEPTQENKILWKEQGTETIILTCIYSEKVNLEKEKVAVEEAITLYDNKQTTLGNELVLSNEEKDSVLEVYTKHSEEKIYKGKLYAGIDRTYEATTTAKINLSEAIETIKITENQDVYAVNETTNLANVVYNKTIISKEQFDKILGELGTITIQNQKGEEIAKIDSSIEPNENGEIEISYEGKEPKGIIINTTSPILNGELEFKHIKTIKQEDKQLIKTAKNIQTNVVYNYSQGIEQQTIAQTNLLESTTQAELEINKTELSTIVTNNVEIKAILQSNNEQYDLYENPSITIKLPEEIEEIKINSVDLLYENELNIKNYDVNGKEITLNLEGKQTQYKETAIEGSVIIIKASLDVNRKSTSKETIIKMNYENDNVNTYASESVEKNINIVAPTEVTTINSIKDLSIETLGNTPKETATVARGDIAKQYEMDIEIINNEQTAIKNVKILGQFPTNNKTNNMNIKVISALEEIENATIYYSENENATNDIQNTENAWTAEITNNAEVKKYLIVMDEIPAQESIKTSYKIEIPENLEYNQVAEESYTISYTNGQARAEKQITSTIISLETGIGPVIETTLTATVQGNAIDKNTTVKNGEVIEYQLKIANTGSQDIENLRVAGNVPEGTVIVVPDEEYEYAGAIYYRELQSTEYVKEIAKLPIGETITCTYQVRVNTDTEAETVLSNKMKVNYLDVIKESNEVQVKTEKGDLRISVKRITDRTIDLYPGEAVKYAVIIENISDETQENVKVKTNLSSNVNVELLSVVKGMPIYSELTTENAPIAETQDIEYKDEFNIGAIEPGENRVLVYGLVIEKPETITFSVNVNNKYQSNSWQDEVKKYEIKLDMTSNTKSEYVKAGDTIKYTIDIENIGKTQTSGLTIVDTIPSQLTIQSVTVDGEELSDMTANEFQMFYQLKAQEKGTIEIQTIVNDLETRTKAEAITNVAKAEIDGEMIATSSEITHIILPNENTSGDNNSENSDNNVADNNIATGNKTITGMAWLDTNANGKKDDEELELENIKVKLLNTQTNNFVKDIEGNELEATTNENGIYVLSNIGNGKYLVIFEYDNTQYALTTYKVDGASETENSDAIENELQIGNEKQKVASTDIIEMENKNISGINIGLIELKNFDLKLEKFVSKIIIQNTTGTTVREYNNATIAKIELDKKTIDGTTAIIEYQIKVTNVGEVEGYVKKIADYAPSNLKFSSELNKDWYQSEDALYNASLANEPIAVGESKIVTLTLTKSLTGDNIGAFNNTAEIAEDYNTLGFSDSNSTPANKTQGENDMGSADVIISVRTGGAIIYISIIIGAILILGITGSVVYLKKKKGSSKDLDQVI